LSALGIVAKEQMPARCNGLQNRPDFRKLFVIISFTVLLVQALMHEFVRIARAIIHGAAQSKKLPTISFIAGFIKGLRGFVFLDFRPF
jgi:hypothetical protein